MLACMELLDPEPCSDCLYHRTIFRHRPPLGPALTLWWPCRITDALPEVVILFIPGNPGLVDLYSSFLSAIREMDRSGRMSIYAHAHIGHSPGLESICQDTQRSNFLFTQIQGVLEIFDALKVSFPSARIILVGHSVGAWIALQILKTRSVDVAGAFLLFPTISHIARTPNGRALSWAFRSPMPSIISQLAQICHLVPIIALTKLFPSWSIPQLRVLRQFLCSSSSIYAALRMAHDEMEEIKDLDKSFLTANRHRLWIFLAERDDWVGHQKEILLQVFDSDKIVHGSRDVPHAFCVCYGERVAAQCHEWLGSATQNLVGKPHYALRGVSWAK